MRYKEIEELEAEKFRRLTEVKKARSRRRSKLRVEDRLLIALEYMRE